MDNFWVTLINSFAEGILALVGAGILYLMTLLKNKILTETDKIKDDKQRNLVNGAIERVSNLAEISVRNAENVAVREAKKATEDNKLTKEDAESIKQAVIEDILGKLSDDTKKVINDEYGNVEAYVDELIEAKVHELTKLSK